MRTTTHRSPTRRQRGFSLIEALITLFVFAVVLWMLSGTLVRWMHGAEDVKHA